MTAYRNCREGVPVAILKLPLAIIFLAVLSAFCSLSRFPLISGTLAAGFLSPLLDFLSFCPERAGIIPIPDAASIPNFSNCAGIRNVDLGLSRDQVHMFVEIPPQVSVSDFVRRAKGRSSRKIQQEFEHIRKRYWGQRFWARGYFSTTSGNITDDVIENYLNQHTAKDGFSPSS